MTLSANVGMCLTRNRNCISLIGATVTPVSAMTRRAPRAIVDQSHFAENAFRPQSFEATASAPDLDFAANEHKKFVAMVALFKDRVSCREASRWDFGSQEKAEINCVVCHFTTLAD